MKAPIKATVLLVSAILVLGTFGLASGQAVFVNMDEVGGLVDGFIPEAGADLVIPVHFMNSTDLVTCISNGFDFSSDKVTFGPIDTVGLVTWNPAYPWDLAHAIQLWIDGGMVTPFPTNADAYFDMMTSVNLIPNGLGFAGITGTGTGLPNGFDDVAYTITVPGVFGDPGAVLTMDSTFWDPSNIWVWCNESGVDVSWGGPYDFVVDGYVPPYTDCTPQPTVLHADESEKYINFHLYNEEVELVDLTSLLVGDIKSHDDPFVEDGVITMNIGATHFIGATGFRPIPPEGIQSTYTLTYSYLDGTAAPELIGDWVLNVVQADVNFDGVGNIADLTFMVDYLFYKGDACTLHGENYMEMMDIDLNGQFDIRDIRKAIEIIL